MRLEVRYECRLCPDKRFSTDDEALAHTVEHEPDFVQKLSDDDLRRQADDLPVIYWQGAWHLRHGENEYVEVGDLVRCPWDVWTQVIPHSLFIGMRVHDINRGAMFSHLPKPVKFAKKHSEHQRSPSVRCSTCPQIFSNARVGEVGEHIFRAHKSALFKLA